VSTPALVIQTFIKIDTLQSLCDSLLQCENRQKFDLIFFSDHVKGSRRADEYAPKIEAVQNYLKLFSARYDDQFNSISLRRNSANYGTCKTCQLAIDYAFERHKFVVFTEDDTIFARDALSWFLAMEQTSAFMAPDIWAIAGESDFFDSKRESVAEAFKEQARTYAEDNKLWRNFIIENYLPSTCFATNQAKWTEFSTTRGQPLGDVDVCARCAIEGKRCIFPVLARVKDVGMLHTDGYSVSIHSVANVRGIKNCYLMSDEVLPEPNVNLRPELYRGNINRLYWQSTLLNGFAESSQRPSLPDRALLDLHKKLLLDARSAANASDWASALNCWNELLAAGLDTHEVNGNIALCFLKLSLIDEARIKIEDVIEKAPDAGFAQSIMAYILEADGLFPKAWNIWNALAARTDLPDWLISNAIAGQKRCAQHD
jgi:hypothetical protein